MFYDKTPMQATIVQPTPSDEESMTLDKTEPQGKTR